MKYFGDSFRFGPAVNLFEKLVVKEGEIACLLAQSYFGMSKLLRPSCSILLPLNNLLTYLTHGMIDQTRK